MIREKKKTNILNLKKVFPRFFWRECCMCGREFKKQYGWRFDTFNWDHIEHSYICNECAETEPKAINIVSDINKYSIEYAYYNNIRVEPTLNTVPPAPPKQPKRRV